MIPVSPGPYQPLFSTPFIIRITQAPLSSSCMVHIRSTNKPKETRLFTAPGSRVQRWTLKDHRPRGSCINEAAVPRQHRPFMQIGEERRTLTDGPQLTD